MSKLIIVAIPDEYYLDNVIARIKNAFYNDEKIDVIPAKSYQAVKDYEANRESTND